MRKGYLWHQIALCDITYFEAKSSLHCTTLFKLLEVGKTTPLHKQLWLISNSKTINTHEPLPLNGQPRIRAVKTNSMHELTSSKLPTLQVTYFSQRAINTTLSSYILTHGLATTSPFTCPFLCFFSIASHQSLLWVQTWGVFKWMINRLWKQKQNGKATFHFTFQFTTSFKAKQRTWKNTCQIIARDITLNSRALLNVPKGYLWHQIALCDITYFEAKSSLHCTTLFKLLEVGKTMPLHKQLRLISNTKTTNTRELLPLNGQPRIRAVKTNSMHKLTSSKSPTLQVTYLSQRATNNSLKLKITHGLATTFPFTCPFLCSFPIASHWSLLWVQTLGGFEWMINRLCKQKQNGKATFHFIFQFTTSSKAKPRTLTFCSCKSFACPAGFIPSLFTVPSRPAPSARPGRLRNKAERQSSQPFAEPTHALFQGRARTQALTTRNSTLELPTFGVIARFNPIQVQWKGLTLRGLITVPTSSGKFFCVLGKWAAPQWG